MVVATLWAGRGRVNLVLRASGVVLFVRNQELVPKETDAPAITNVLCFVVEIRGTSSSGAIAAMELPVGLGHGVVRSTSVGDGNGGQCVGLGVVVHTICEAELSRDTGTRRDCLSNEGDHSTKIREML